MVQDILEDNIVKYGRSLLDILLQDKTTKKNIIWATDNYEKYGDMYKAHKEITSALIIGSHTKIIKSRTTKAKEHQSSRTRDKAEVFTPAWLCNQQNNLIDEQWFDRPNVFNISSGESWFSITGKIDFPQEKRKTWKDYVDARRLEVACGEAPYLVSRYDAVTGKVIPVLERIGLLDRKFRVVNENLEDEDAWLKWAIRAVQSTYGYEFQGDNLLLARANILYTFIDNMRYKFGHEPTLVQLKKVANIIAWNIWQMDGLKYTIPYGSVREDEYQMSIFDFLPSAELEEREDENLISIQISSDTTYCKIRDWRAEKTVDYVSLVKGEC